MESINIPTRLTLFRLAFSPLILPILLVYVLPYNILWLNIILGIIFMLLGFTDFFDGYLARKYNQVTLLGKILDPLADKFLTYSALIGLLVAHKIFFYWVIVLIGREFFVMGIRHVALEYHFSIPVSKLGKLKTALQMVTITCIIINPYHGLKECGFHWNGIELGLLIGTLILSVVTAQQYYDAFMRQLKKKLENTDPVSDSDTLC